jgi:putative lipoic acid-binding regulatory protein
VDEPEARPAGIEGVELPGPFPVGVYAAKLKDFLQDVERVQRYMHGDQINQQAKEAQP